MSDAAGNMTCSEAAAFRLNPGSGEESEQNLVWFGILLGFTASVVINLGQNLEAGEKEKRKEKNTANGESSKKTTQELVGLSMLITGAIANFVAFAFAPASVLAPLEGAQFLTHYVYNILWKERWHWNHFHRSILIAGLGTALVMVSIAVPVFVTPSDVAVFDESAIICFWERGNYQSAWWLYLYVSAALCCACGVLYLVYTSPLCVLEDTKASKLAQENTEETKRSSIFFMGLYTIPAASIGSIGVVQSKVISELTAGVFDGEWTFLKNGLFYITLILVLFGILIWVYMLLCGPLYFETTKILPMMQGAYIVFSSMAGGIFFEEFDKLNPTQSALYAVSMCTLLLGIGIVTRGMEIKKQDTEKYEQYKRNDNCKCKRQLSEYDVNNDFNESILVQDDVVEGYTDLPVPSSIVIGASFFPMLVPASRRPEAGPLAAARVERYPTIGLHL
jgi:hypothetical protein